METVYRWERRVGDIPGSSRTRDGAASAAFVSATDRRRSLDGAPRLLWRSRGVSSY
ncbi:MAG: hypothetical protein JWQ02_849 [Capsulimonas sp.]|nr:hypothetical protein [Capsulimonas sp.]